ncbi:3-oxoacyl-[acyl-carrier protein] reductase [Dethiosulfatibacter aminovorans DSM 17477]|uniref:3-oxoacyl-[acyl-carrier protein] reductase n=1 Tax=Dethiosulfatibacter aminovorans DSM 17477 TaxID=1121476 RepID=A0A1M6JMR1_9FIRM|nr:SDR family oxidoreductase [Dethiosulfatibacter aminovorans]SHJ47950.1 3-oxoacyl-[acyl-carrier protein] reductase [Dethiosulfatibacter aminovorans DSM 17477]
MNEFKDKVVVISGAGAGMAAEQAKHFLEEGAYVIGLDVNGAGLKEVREKNIQYSDHFLSYEVDISKKDQIETAITEATKNLKHIDVLVNTAGVFDKYTPMMDIDEKLWDLILNVNVKGMFMLSQAVLPYMLDQNKGVIINIASAAGVRGSGGGVAYTASKHGVLGLTKRMSFELGPKGIRVLAVGPGRISTQMNEGTANLIDERLPAQRNGKVSEIADVILFLASEKADYIHGGALMVDGGWTIL